LKREHERLKSENND
jgi:predicted  nucleic acid-binding Zn-ribbon protein